MTGPRRHIATRLFALAMLAAGTGDALARPVILAGPAIRETLLGVTLEGDGWRQTFTPTGEAIYLEGGGTYTGRWEVRGDEYCSQWPPSDEWGCYRVFLDADEDPPTVRFVDDTDEQTDGHIIKKGQ